MRSLGSLRLNWRTTANPPRPESKTPIGALDKSRLVGIAHSLRSFLFNFTNHFTHTHIFTFGEINLAQNSGTRGMNFKGPFLRNDFQEIASLFHLISFFIIPNTDGGFLHSAA